MRPVVVLELGLEQAVELVQVQQERRLEQEQEQELLVQPVLEQEQRLVLLVPAVELVQERQAQRLEQERQVLVRLLACHQALRESY